MPRQPIARGRPLLVLAAGTLLSGALASSAAAATPVHLTVTKLSKPPVRVVAGTRFHVTDTTRNVGPATTKKTVTAYLASKDRKPSKGDVVLGKRTVKGLKPRRGSRVRRTVTVPVATKAAKYYLIACAAVRGKRYQRAACRASAKRMSILAATPANTAAPSVGGQPVDGATLVAKAGAWRGLTPIRYAQQWRRCNGRGVGCEDIAG